MYLHSAYIQLQTGRFEDGIVSADAGMEAVRSADDLELSDFLMVRAALYLQLNQPDSAMADYNSVLLQRPDDMPSRGGRIISRIQKAAGEPIGKMDVIGGIDNIDFQTLVVPELIAFAQHPGMDFNESRVDARLLMERNPNSAYPIVLYGAVLAAMGKPYCPQVQKAARMGYGFAKQVLKDCR